MKNSISALQTVRTFIKVGTCSETLCNVLDRAFGQPLPLEEHATTPLAGGIMQNGYQCGMIWGAALAAGAQAYRLYDAGAQAESRAILAAQKAAETFRGCYHTIDCYDITHINNSSTINRMLTYFFLQGGAIKCYCMAAKYAPQAGEQINIVLTDGDIQAPAAPVSCAAVLAQRLGASPLHTVMAAGLAGGIGLCGGACGALGAAIWLGELQNSQMGVKVEYKSITAQQLVEKFLSSSGYEFECSKITGQKFATVDDHAAFICKGGCANILEVLTSYSQQVHVDTGNEKQHRV
ncbi:MAG TPA: C-GCAxxG-C-C family (seleno)protein [bacterium]|nr:C-GCAxxG-C-C family (seleno)protein [bacterium]HPN45745.1 C-GCAxxG-C-C family (seleno)protein [bacterium]